MNDTLKDFLSTIETEMASMQQQAIAVAGRGGSLQTIVGYWNTLCDARKKAKDLQKELGGA